MFLLALFLFSKVRVGMDTVVAQEGGWLYCMYVCVCVCMMGWLV